MASRYDNIPNNSIPNNNMKKGPNWGRWFLVIFIILLALCIGGGVLIYRLGHDIFSLTNYVDQQTQTIVREEELPKEAVETAESEELLGTVVNESELANIHEQMTAIDQKIETLSNENVYNLLLVGVDRRDKTWNGNSDSMMLISLNFHDERVSIISLMRDTYVNIPDVGYNKLNNSYARGGGDLLCATVSDNFNIDVSRYAAVDFEDMIYIIDALGGVELDITPSEADIMNNVYTLDMCNTLGLDYEKYVVPEEGGTVLCQGVPAVAYARNRFVGNSDYARTERQRYVISQMIKKVKGMSVPELMNFARKVLPLVSHNVKEGDIWELITKAPAVLKYDFVTDRVPYDGMYDIIIENDQDMLVPYWEPTITKMHETIYGSGAVSDNYDNTEDGTVVTSVDDPAANKASKRNVSDDEENGSDEGNE